MPVLTSLSALSYQAQIGNETPTRCFSPSPCHLRPVRDVRAPLAGALLQARYLFVYRHLRSRRTCVISCAGAARLRPARLWSARRSPLHIDHEAQFALEGMLEEIGLLVGVFQFIIEIGQGARPEANGPDILGAQFWGRGEV